MADIDSIIAGISGNTRADFSGLGDPVKAFFDASKQRSDFDTRRAFQDGVPTTPDGQPDFAAMEKALFQKGDIASGTSLSNLDLQRQQLQQNQEGARFSATGQTAAGQPSQAPVLPPSVNRSGSTPVAPALGNGGAPPQQGNPATGSPQSATLAQVLTARGIPNDQISAASASLSRQLGLQDPNQQLNLQDPQVRNVLVPAIQQLKRMGIGQVQPPPGGILQAQPAQAQPQAQPQGQPPQSTPPAQAAPQVLPQQAQPQSPSPFANAVAAGLIPPGVDPARYVAGMKYRAAALPKGPAQEAIQAQVNAIDKASELTQSQRDYNASQANPKIDERAAQQKGDEATATARAQSDVKEQDGIIADGRAAQTRLNTLNTVANIVQSDKNLTLGFGGETALKLKKALEQIGVNVGDLSGAQTIEKLNAALASEAAKSVSPRPAQFEFKTFLANNPGLSLDKAGNLRVLGIFSQLAKRDVDLGRMARANRDNWDNWDNVVQQYDKNHPIMDPVTHTPLSTDSVIAPKAQSQSATTTASPAGAISEGATAFNPKTGERIRFIGGKWSPTA